MLSILVVLTIVLIGASAVYRARWKSCQNPKSGFASGTGMVPISNFDMAGMSPLWQRGSLATGGLLEHDEVSPTQTAAYVARDQPPLRRTLARRANMARMVKLARMAASGNRETYKTGEDPSEYEIVENGMDPDLFPGDCANGWDKDAVIETQALAALGSDFGPPASDEARLDSAGEGAYDTSRGLSDQQLTTLMKFGGAP